MAAFRFTTVFCICFAIAMPLDAFSRCSCALGDTSPNCGCCTTRIGTCCCASPQSNDESCCSKHRANLCEPACNCLDAIENDGIVATELKQPVDVPTFVYPLELAHAIFAHSNVTLSPLDRPPVGHNQRQATLRVWLK